MLPFGDATYEAERWKQELARVEAERANRIARQRPSQPMGQRAGELLARIGHRLVNTGCALQARYTTSQPGNRCP
ncbi:MAG: hypothetical protein P8129_19390 [Anaerolineae bacterium]|jgi:hypothetical protein